VAPRHCSTAFQSKRSGRSTRSRPASARFRRPQSCDVAPRAATSPLELRRRPSSCDVAPRLAFLDRLVDSCPRATANERVTSSKKTVVTDLQKAAQEGKKKLAAALQIIGKLRGQGTEAFDELWEQVRDVLEAEPPLWRHGHDKSEADLIRRELPGETARSVRRNMLVATGFTPKDEADKGISFLEKLALYAQQRAGASKPPAAIDIDRMFVVIPSGKLGVVRGVHRAGPGSWPCPFPCPFPFPTHRQGSG
jgi:hypothetical protein